MDGGLELGGVGAVAVAGAECGEEVGAEDQEVAVVNIDKD